MADGAKIEVAPVETPGEFPKRLQQAHRLAGSAILHNIPIKTGLPGGDPACHKWRNWVLAG